MTSIEHRKAIRRANVALLLDQYGQTRLSELTDIAPAYLYQFGKARGKSKRNVNDDYARTFEVTLNLGDGWMDEDHSGKEKDHSKQVAQPKHKQVSSVGRWPFEFDWRRWERVPQKLQQEIGEWVEGRVLKYEQSNHPATRPKSRTARSA